MGDDLSKEIIGFASDLKEFRDDINLQLKEQEKRMSMLDRKMNDPKSVARMRAPLASASEGPAPHQKAFEAYVRSGDETPMHALEFEMKQAVTADGGFLASRPLIDAVNNAIQVQNPMRAVANVVQIEGATYEALLETSEINSAWQNADTLAAPVSGVSTQKVTIPLHELAAMPKLTQRLLDDSAFDVESWLAERISDHFARAESAAFINGTGSGQPLGILRQPPVANNGMQNGRVGYIATGAAGDFKSGAPADALVDLVYALPAHYRANAHFMMNSKTAGAVRKMKDSDGRFLWADSLANGQPAQLMGYPVLICEDMPDIAANSFAVLFGDFRAAYTIVERPDLRILRDPFSAKPYVLFYATKRVGGGLVNGLAVKALKFAAS